MVLPLTPRKREGDAWSPMPAMAVLMMVCAIIEVVMGVAGPDSPPAPDDPARSDVGDESDPARSESTGGAHSAIGVAGAGAAAELEAACGGAGVAGAGAADGFIH
eukprot:4125170-Amphidinium_carterae.1